MWYKTKPSITFPSFSFLRLSFGRFSLSAIGLPSSMTVFMILPSSFSFFARSAAFKSISSKLPIPMKHPVITPQTPPLQELRVVARKKKVRQRDNWTMQPSCHEVIVQLSMEFGLWMVGAKRGSAYNWWLVMEKEKIRFSKGLGFVKCDETFLKIHSTPKRCVICHVLVYFHSSCSLIPRFMTWKSYRIIHKLRAHKIQGHEWHHLQIA